MNGCVCGVSLMFCDDSTRCLGIRDIFVVGMGACHGIAPATVERERCVSELMHRGGVGFGSGSLSPDRAVCGVLSIGSHELTRCLGIRFVGDNGPLSRFRWRFPIFRITSHSDRLAGKLLLDFAFRLVFNVPIPRCVYFMRDGEPSGDLSRARRRFESSSRARRASRSRRRRASRHASMNDASR